MEKFEKYSVAYALIKRFVAEIEASGSSNDFSILYRIMKELKDGHKFFYRPERNINTRFLIHDGKQLRRR